MTPLTGRRDGLPPGFRRNRWWGLQVAGKELSATSPGPEAQVVLGVDTVEFERRYGRGLVDK